MYSYINSASSSYAHLTALYYAYASICYYASTLLSVCPSIIRQGLAFSRHSYSESIKKLLPWAGYSDLAVI